MQDPCAIAVLYSTHFPYIEFQDCEGDHAKVIYKYVKMYLKIPLVISFVENEMVKRGMDTSVGQHVLNSMWSPPPFFCNCLASFRAGKCLGSGTTAATCTMRLFLKLGRFLWMYSLWFFVS